MKVKRGQTIELEIEKFADRGKGLARVDGLVVFVEDAVPGDRVRAYVHRLKRNYAEAKLDALLEPSALRTEPRCPYADPCGGCVRQHVAYPAQLEAKQRSVREALVHHGGFEDVHVRPILGAERIYDYRNRMDFNFSAERWLTRAEIDSGEDFDTDFALGLHPQGQPFKVLDLHECHLQSERSRRLVNSVRTFVKQREWKPWSIREHVGFLRHLVIRESERTGEAMVNLVTNGRNEARVAELATLLQDEFPGITTFVNTVSTGAAQTVYGEAEHVVFGPGTIHDRIGPYTFEISPTAFFQTNTAQAERLYEAAREMAALRPEDHVYDLYCGTGAIALFVSGHVRSVVGVEMSEDAVENACANAAANDVENCAFVAGDTLKVLTPEFAEEHGRPDALVVDPPRAGLHKKVARQIAALRPERLVYVSCNPQTQARDLKRLKDAYRIDAVQPVDMFPHTHHVENVVRLTSVA